MPKKKIKIRSTDFFDELSAEERDFLDVLISGDLVYENVVARLKIPKENAFYRNSVIAMLKKLTRDHIVTTIWKNLRDDNQISHLQDRLNFYAKHDPEIPHQDIFMEFALMYPKLKSAVLESLEKFFKNFVDRFNKISEA